MEPLDNEHFGTSYFLPLSLLQYRGFPHSKVKNVLVTPVGTIIFVLIMEISSIVSLIQRFVKRVPLYIAFCPHEKKFCSLTSLPLFPESFSWLSLHRLSHTHYI